MYYSADYIDGLAQDCSNSFANALELLQSYAKPSIWPNPGVLIISCVNKIALPFKVQYRNGSLPTKETHTLLVCGTQTNR